jgi:hypothetical protein
MRRNFILLTLMHRNNSNASSGKIEATHNEFSEMLQQGPAAQPQWENARCTLPCGRAAKLQCRSADSKITTSSDASFGSTCYSDRCSTKYIYDSDSNQQHLNDVMRQPINNQHLIVKTYKQRRIFYH